MRRIELDCLVIGLLLGASSAVVACGGASSTTAPVAAAPSGAASADDDESSIDLREHHAHHHQGGVIMFVAMSLDSLGVSPEQAAAIEKIQGDLFAKMEPARAAERDVLNVLADGIAAGKIDDGKVDAAIEKVKSASGGVHDASLDALGELHKTLTPEQRAALMDKVEAHWEVWKSANQEAIPSDVTRAGHLDYLAQELNLSADQVGKIRATFDEKMKNHPAKFDPTQVDAHIKEFGAAFKAATFDAKSLPHGPFAGQHLAAWGATRMAHFYEAIDPLLTAEQRTKLSAELKEHASAKSGIFDGDKNER